MRLSPAEERFDAKTHLQNLLLAQPSQGLFISDSTPRAAYVGVWANVSMSAVQILELYALTHVEHKDRDRRKFDFNSKTNCCLRLYSRSKIASGFGVGYDRN